MKNLIAVIMLCIIVGCSHGTHHSVPEDIIYINKDTVPEWQLPPEEIADDRVRFTGHDISLIYEEGGIIVEQSKDHYRSIKYVELASGCVVTLTSYGRRDDELQLVTLTINGREIEVKSAIIVNENRAAIWIDVLTAANKHYLLVM